MSEQLSLFEIHPTQTIKAVADPYWDEITEPTIKPGDLVKLSAEWMKNQADATAGKYKKDYQFKSEDDLVCKVLWVDPRGNGNISVDRNGYGLFVPAGNFTSVDEGDTVNHGFGSGITTDSTKHPLLSPVGVTSGLFTEENVRAQDTQISSTSRKHPESDAVTCAPEHFQSENFAPEHTHWTEEYWTKRGNKKHYYYRYCWMVGRKKYRMHIGSVNSPIAQAKREEIENAIAIGKSPDEIRQMLKTTPVDFPLTAS